MKEVIYLTLSRSKVEKMTKNLPEIRRGELPVKITVIVDEKAFREPVITKEVVINDWREGIDMADVEFRQSFITPDEAEAIRQQRLQKMATILREQGYSVVTPEAEEKEAE